MAQDVSPGSRSVSQVDSRAFAAKAAAGPCRLALRLGRAARMLASVPAFSADSGHRGGMRAPHSVGTAGMAAGPGGCSDLVGSGAGAWHDGQED